MAKEARRLDKERIMESNIGIGAEGLESMETLATGQCCDLKIDTGEVRVWLCRVEGGVTIEYRNESGWVTVEGGCMDRDTVYWGQERYTEYRDVVEDMDNGQLEQAVDTIEDLCRQNGMGLRMFWRGYTDHLNETETDPERKLQLLSDTMCAWTAYRS